MLKQLKKRWWLYSGIIVIIAINSFEPFKSNGLAAMGVAAVIGLVIVILMAVIPTKPSDSTGTRS